MVDFSCGFYKIEIWKVVMKELFKSFLTVLAFTSAFLIGYRLGQEHIFKKIPNFQEEYEEQK